MKKRKNCMIALAVIIGLSYINQTITASDFYIGKRALAIDEYECILYYSKNNLFQQARNFKCNKQKTKEILSKSKREKILVTQQD